MGDRIGVVHLVAKTHLDLGFTALAAEVEEGYRTEFFPRALATAAELRAAGGGERLVWTTGSWILHRALADADPVRAAAVAAGVRAGDLAWHGLAVTTHTELLDVARFRAGLGISAELDARFGRTTVAAKMTDVPGHTRSMVPLLADAGVRFLHLGVNPAWPVPDVPPVFRWRSPDGAEVVVAYRAGGYGGDVVVPGCDAALTFLHAGDNLGPPSAAEVVAAHRGAAERFGGAEVRASTLDGFARDLLASGAVADLPVITAEIGDPWLFGAGSDPQKVAAYRALLAATPEGAGPEVDRDLLLVAEHTWGLDQKVALPEDRRWDRDGLAEVRASEAGARFEASWAEQRGYVERAAARLGPAGRAAIERLGRPGRPRRGSPWDHEGHRRLGDGEAVHLGGWAVSVDPVTGALALLRQEGSGRVLADADHPLGRLAYQSFDEADYERFYAGLCPVPDDEWWARWDNTKPGIDACGAVHGTWHPEVVGAWAGRSPDGAASLRIELRFGGLLADRLGAPPTAWADWTFPDARTAALAVHWDRKPANRLPEALWCGFVPAVADPARWELDKLGQRVSPLDVVRHGGRGLHGVGEGAHYAGPDGRLALLTPDATLVAPGAPALLDPDPPVPDLAGGLHVLLLDNCWGTNFPMWSEGPASFRFELRT
jgi:hypothetical protein